MYLFKRRFKTQIRVGWLIVKTLAFVTYLNDLAKAISFAARPRVLAKPWGLGLCHHKINDSGTAGDDPGRPHHPQL